MRYYFSLYTVCISGTTVFHMGSRCMESKHWCATDESVNWHRVTGGQFDSVYKILNVHILSINCF